MAGWGWKHADLWGGGESDQDEHQVGCNVVLGFTFRGHNALGVGICWPGWTLGTFCLLGNRVVK